MESKGKVLLLGGYLILFPEYFGVVLQINAKISVTASPSANNYLQIVSERFGIDATYDPNSGILESGNSNNYIDASVKIGITLLNLPVSGYVLTINSDPIFYEGGKSGLGSSACLITSLMKAMFKISGISDNRLLNLSSQLANKIAQNKIGSGFDISTCIYGSQIFRRVQSNVLSTDFDSLTKEMVYSELSSWTEPESFELPEEFVMVLCEGSGGSSTVSLSRQMIEWHKQSHAQEMFRSLHNLNQQILEAFITRNVQRVKELSTSTKELVRNISIDSGVDVLPECVYNLLLDIETEITSIVFSLVPGAGGYDAYYLIVLSEQLEEALACLRLKFPSVKVILINQDSY